MQKRTRKDFKPKLMRGNRRGERKQAVKRIYTDLRM